MSLGYNIDMWQKRAYNKDIEETFVKQGQHKLIARLLAQRNLILDNSEDFTKPSYKKMSDPNSLVGIKEAVEIFCQTVLKKQSVAIIGDYDVDGIISTVMLSTICKTLGVECKIFLPSRLDHGYGLNPKTISAFIEKMKTPPYLLMIADCGSNNEAEIVKLKEFGIKKVVILDHHLIDEQKMSKSADALVNWRLQSSEEMCACGEVFQFIRALGKLTKKINPVEYLTYAAIGTIADMSPIIGDNRIIVRRGLSQEAINYVVSNGLNSLIRKSKIFSDSLTQEDIHFKIAPRINASGRLLVPDISYNLLIEEDPSMADLMADRLSEHNENRKFLQRNIASEAEKMVKDNLDQYENGILVYNSNWHIGVVGIVASRLTETFHKPAIVIGGHNGLLKGSGRSIKGVNIKEVLDNCPDEMFEGYGGHEMAVGLTLKQDFISKANKEFNNACKKYFDHYNIEKPVRYYDVELKPQTISEDTVHLLLGTMYPYCPHNNPEPIFKLSDVEVLEAELIEFSGLKSLSFVVQKGGFVVPFKMRYFTTTIGSEIGGMTVDLYFNLPQSLGKYTVINVVDIEIKK